MKRKWLAVGIILLFLWMRIIPSTAQDIEKSPLSTLSGNWLYVGGSGPGNYSRIQDAIDNTSNGDTVFVYSGWYNESISISKSIFVYGQDRKTTYIGRGEDIYTSVRIFSDDIQFKGFSLKGNDVTHGVYISDCTKSHISDNYIEECAYGIIIERCNLVVVSKNNIRNCTFGMSIEISNNTTIVGNVIDGVEQGDGYGIWILGFSDWAYKNTVKRNTIMNYLYGLFLTNSLFTVVQENNFLSNKNLNAAFSKSFYTVWKQNYWDRSYLLPKIIVGAFNPLPFTVVPYFNFDWRPAREPYDIPGMS